MTSILNILVTGGAGFLGSHLCEKLLNQGHKVICLDNFYSSDRDNISCLIDNPNFSFIEEDVCNSKINFNIDQIYNLACPASPIHYQSNPVKTVQTNVLGSLNMLELAKKNNAKILQASTSEIYGDPKINPQSENYWGNVNPIGIRSCYDEGKRCAETLFFDYHRQYKINIKVCRIFNTYGPKMHKNDGRVMSNFIIQALQNLPITIYGKGSQTRSFCYVDDLIDGIIRFMNTDNNITGPINLGSNQEISIKDLAVKIINSTNSKSEIKFLKPLSDDPMQRKPDLKLAKKIIDWNFNIELDNGIKKTIKFFKENLDGLN
jgi:UDP-glucuronate decarboxylase